MEDKLQRERDARQQTDAQLQEERTTLLRLGTPSSVSA
jgi:hypothetical protein